ncbi:hypothetical protein EDB89DRAFT_2071552 [Lactarius sanguifluus]|nr:hypothetical protein EDB89DRAFT_2071552 [Lactarius sanguifluus]
MALEIIRRRERFIEGKHEFESYRHAATINVLPDNVLLETFIFCLRKPHESPLSCMLAWRRLAHVCQKWRQIIFSSPRRLDLQLLCTHGTPVRENIGCWPAFPISIEYHVYWNPGSDKGLLPNDEDNVIAALEHSDRIRCVKLTLTSSLLDKVATVMQEPFPALTLLRLSSEDQNVPILPHTFLAGSAPSLQEIYLEGIPFPSLPTLFLSASGLINIQLHNIPRDGYISPQALATGLAALTRLETLSIRFQSSDPNFRSIPTPPLARLVLPSLTMFGFRGNSEYLEGLVAQIDAPRLVFSRITYFNQLIFQVPHLSQFIGRTENFGLAPFRHAQVGFRGSNIYISFGFDWQVSSMAQILSQSSVLLSDVGHLSIHAHRLRPGWKNDVDHTEWLDLLHPFTVVETLLVSRQLAGHVALALRDVTGETVAEVLPALYLLCLEGQFVGPVTKFAAVRQHSGRPVTTVGTLSEFLNRRRFHPCR